MDKRFFFVLLGVSVCISCDSIESTPMQRTPLEMGAQLAQEVSIKPGEPGASFAQRYAQLVRIQHQPAGVDFYSIDWDQKSPGIVRLDRGVHSLTIEYVLTVQGAEEVKGMEGEGLKTWTLFSGITAPDRISHDEARLKTYAILHRILDAGWQQVIERSEPRLREKARQDYMFATSNLNGLDATYLPNFGEWMRIESRTPWSFYADGVYLDVSFTRESTLTDPAKLGSYLLTFHVQTQTEYFRGFAGPENRARWKDLLAGELEKDASLRAQKEAELRAKGVAIDESYRDPPVPALK